MNEPTLMTPYPLASMPVEACPWLQPGQVIRWNNRVLVRHLSELLCSLAGATWHVNGHCPTWTDEAECLCMVEEAP